MNKQDQIEIAKEICKGLEGSVMESIDGIPAEWNGIEIRQWIAELAAERYTVRMDRARMREYKNSWLVLNV